ncbi:MAG: aryl-sulfate sulfotransferase, partial [Desulfobacterales bacterium]
MRENLKSPNAILPLILSTARVWSERSFPFLRDCILAGIAVFLVCIPLIAPAHAQGRAEMIMKNADADGDGRIGRKEWKGPPPRFDHFDADGDGYLTLDELRGGLAGARGANALQRPGRAMPDQATRPGAKAGGREKPAPPLTKPCTYQDVASPESKWKIENFAPDCAYAGTTLFADNTDRQRPRIVEVDMHGRIVWEYKLSGEFSSSRRELLQIMDVERLPNGNTLFVLRGWGVVEVNRNGQRVWKHADKDASHDADRLPNGNTIYVRGWVAKGQDHMREVAADGKVVRSWNGRKDYDRPPFAKIKQEGWIHVNAVQSMANGDVFLSLRNFGVLARLAPDGRIVQEIALPLNRAGVDAFDFANKAQQTSPHDPEYREDGTVSVCLTMKNTCLDFNA